MNKVLFNSYLISTQWYNFSRRKFAFNKLSPYFRVVDNPRVKLLNFAKAYFQLHYTTTTKNIYLLSSATTWETAVTTITL